MASSLPIAISLLAALGVGSIAAAFISRWNAVSQLRQAWVEALRKEIAEFFDAMEKVGEAFSSNPLREKLRERRDHALFVHRQILLRLNLREVDHRRLDRTLTALLTTAGAADAEKVDRALWAARVVLKGEWDRAKYGPLMRVAVALKKRLRQRRRWRERRASLRRRRLAHDARLPAGTSR